MHKLTTNPLKITLEADAVHDCLQRAPFSPLSVFTGKLVYWQLILRLRTQAHGRISWTTNAPWFASSSTTKNNLVKAWNKKKDKRKRKHTIPWLLQPIPKRVRTTNMAHCRHQHCQEHRPLKNRTAFSITVKKP